MLARFATAVGFASITLARPQAVPLAACTALAADTPDAFLSNASFSEAAKSAVVPTGYTQTFSNLDASSQTVGYLTYTTLDDYDVAACAAQCNANSGCLAFNLYFERDPAVEPTAICPNPVSGTSVKCTLWGAPITSENAINTGEVREQFHVVIAGSNGYVNSLIHEIPGYRWQAYGTAAILAPIWNGTDSYITYKFHDAATYDAARCAADCEAETAYNAVHFPANGTMSKKCRFSNSYILSKNGVPQHQVCSLYTRGWPAVYATNEGYYNGTDHYTVSWSFGIESKNGSSRACLPAGASKFNVTGHVTSV